MSSGSAAEAAGAGVGTRYWCYGCSRLVRVWTRDAIVCPICDGDFLEEADASRHAFPGSDLPLRHRFPGASVPSSPSSSSESTGIAAVYPRHRPEMGLRRSRRNATGDRSPFNPVIVLRAPSEGGGRAASSFELYYDDGTGSGLRPLPAGMSDFLMGSGFDRLLDQLAQIEMNGVGGRSCYNMPASKAAMESMPTVEIEDDHVGFEAHCAVCKEPFELGTEAREMPCKHIYHQDCILPWLLLRNSCPVCRHEMPTDVGNGRATRESDGIEQATVGGGEAEAVGLTIWRLPGGGFAVGRFSGGRRAAEGELPVVYTEMDGGFSGSGSPRRISWTSRGSRHRNSGGIGRSLRNFFSFFGRFRRRSSSSNSSTVDSGSGPSYHRGRTGSVFTRRSSRSSSSSWALDDGSGTGVSRW